uniref:G-protein coupled receptors family 1 profile domain-containing protein n=1 Tax=Ditylenchus dipsaci TaxID=166011 RepID=A0A915ET79_9BILA
MGHLGVTSSSTTSMLGPATEYTTLLPTPPPNVTLCSQMHTWSNEYDLFSRVVNGYLTAACVTIGTIGNVMSVKQVRFTNFDRNRGVGLAVAIIILAFWDTLLLCYSSNPLFHAFSQIANTASIWSVVTITVQRYMATRDPFRTTRQNRVMFCSSFRGGGLGNGTKNRKQTQNLLHYLSKYRSHFRVPVFLSTLAILVNVPAFFEIYTIQCYLFPENRMAYGLQISELRLNSYYKLWYKVVFRMLVTSCGPNIFILSLTVLTVLLLRGTSRSRKQLFHMNETAMDRYSSRATMLTMISVMLVIKFLLFRSLSFVLDIWEVTFGLRHRVHQYIYLVDISNFLVLLNSATNCLIIYRGSRWLHEKLAERNTVKRERQLCLNNSNSKRRTALIQASWSQALKLTHNQFGGRVLYAILLKNPQMFAPFRSAPASSVPSKSSTLASLTAIGWREMTSPKPDKQPIVPIITLDTPSFGEYEARLDPYRETIEDVSEDKRLLVEAAAQATLMSALTPTGRTKKKSMDLLMNAKFHAIAEQIMNFIGELIEMMHTGESEHVITARIQAIGKIHHEHGITFPSSAWKEFKSSALSIISNCEFGSEEDRAETLEAWSSFLSVIIKEMKMGCGATEWWNTKTL